MQTRNIISLFDLLNTRVHALDQVMSQPASMLSFLVVRFVLMSGMVVGFTWWSLHLSP